MLPWHIPELHPIGLVEYKQRYICLIHLRTLGAPFQKNLHWLLVVQKVTAQVRWGLAKRCQSQ